MQDCTAYIDIACSHIFPRVSEFESLRSSRGREEWGMGMN
jgi:hypothetical protein